ncbi:hypothetical protein [Eudoraea sp.]|uniref:hypothetical protein n=1 Tax=Eudoraea sp. TaxID=1979955 RepID=UPI003C74A51F
MEQIAGKAISIPEWFVSYLAARTNSIAQFNTGKTCLKPKNLLGVRGGRLNEVSFFQDRVLDYLRIAKKDFRRY